MGGDLNDVDRRKVAAYEAGWWAGTEVRGGYALATPEIRLASRTSTLRRGMS